MWFCGYSRYYMRWDEYHGNVVESLSRMYEWKYFNTKKEALAFKAAEIKGKSRGFKNYFDITVKEAGDGDIYKLTPETAQQAIDDLIKRA